MIDTHYIVVDVASARISMVHSLHIMPIYIVVLQYYDGHGSNAQYVIYAGMIGEYAALGKLVKDAASGKEQGNVARLD